MSKTKNVHRKGKKKDFLFNEIKNDIKEGEILEGMVLRPMILMISFISFIAAMFILLLGNMKWGGSLLIFGFVLNLYSVYQSLEDEASIFRTLNISFKLVLFLSEIVVFNWLLAAL